MNLRGLRPPFLIYSTMSKVSKLAAIYGMTAAFSGVDHLPPLSERIDWTPSRSKGKYRREPKDRKVNWEKTIAKRRKKNRAAKQARKKNR